MRLISSVIGSSENTEVQLVTFHIDIPKVFSICDQISTALRIPGARQVRFDYTGLVHGFYACHPRESYSGWFDVPVLKGAVGIEVAPAEVVLDSSDEDSGTVPSVHEVVCTTDLVYVVFLAECYSSYEMLETVPAYWAYLRNRSEAGDTCAS